MWSLSNWTWSTNLHGQPAIIFYILFNFLVAEFNCESWECLGDRCFSKVYDAYLSVLKGDSLSYKHTDIGDKEGTALNPLY